MAKKFEVWLRFSETNRWRKCRDSEGMPVLVTSWRAAKEYEKYNWARLGCVPGCVKMTKRKARG